MRYHVFLNGFSDEFEKQSLEVLGFIKECCSDIEEGKTIIACRENSDFEKLSVYAPTNDVVFITSDRYIPENILNSCEKYIDDEAIHIYGFDNFSSENSVRMSVRKNGSSLVGVRNMSLSDDCIFGKKMIYSNHMEATFKLKKSPYFISLAKGIFEGQITEGNNKNIFVEQCILNTSDENDVLYYNIEKEDKKEGPENAKLLVVAGRGAKDKASVEKLEEFAESMGGKLGVSRPVAMSAWAPMDKLVGVSGIMAKPKICITAGASGSAAFYAGIEKSDFIVSINTDEKSAIIKKSNVAVVDDFKAIVEELKKYIK